MIKGILYVVATPIGNLKDITLRAIEILSSVDIIFAEDTRVTKKLLLEYNIKTDCKSLNAYNEKLKVSYIAELLDNGQNLALVSDAGTPLICDPGATLISILQTKGYKVIPLPGASSLSCAISMSGMVNSQFCFGGFLPAKSVSRKKILQTYQKNQTSTIFFETPHRILTSLETLIHDFDDPEIFIGKEMTKLFEYYKKDKASNILNWLNEESKRKMGEFVIIIFWPENNIAQDENFTLFNELINKISNKDLIHIGTSYLNIPKNKVYDLIKQHIKP